jgi:hypothetical protein
MERVAAIVLLCIIVMLWFVLPSRPTPAEAFELPGSNDVPTYTSGASMRIADVVATDLYGDFLTKLGEQEGEFYAKYFRAPPSAIHRENPLFHTAFRT